MRSQNPYSNPCFVINPKGTLLKFVGIMVWWKRKHGAPAEETGRASLRRRKERR